ncbi:uncharacterized protein [Haliotis asinina]|uniref:uncharacterized protein n=1 Tax=Haliotis asinina TaxID=109174 RepID=UPI0035323479
MQTVISFNRCFFLVICISITSGLEETHFKKYQSGAPADLDNPQNLHIQQVFRRTTCAALCFYRSCREFQYSDTSRLCITRHTDPVFGGVINPGKVLFDTYKQDPTTCAELRTANPAAHSGEYTIVPSAPQFRGMSVKVFCLMNDTHQLEYVTLPNENIGNFPKRSNSNCRKEHPYLVASGVGRDGVTEYQKIRIIPSTMTVVRTDTTFTSGTKTKPHTYGRAEDCYSYSGTCKRIGTFRINTLGTGMKFATDLQWTASGSRSKVHSITRTHDGAVIDLVCGGWCGRCDPVGDMILYPNTFCITQSVRRVVLPFENPDTLPICAKICTKSRAHRTVLSVTTVHLGWKRDISKMTFSDETGLMFRALPDKTLAKNVESAKGGLVTPDSGSNSNIPIQTKAPHNTTKHSVAENRDTQEDQLLTAITKEEDKMMSSSHEETEVPVEQSSMTMRDFIVRQ